MEKKDNRIFWLDLIRCIAILLVVLCHSVEALYDIPFSNFKNLSTFSKIFRNTFFTLGRLGVPLFLFLTGYLLLYKNIDKTINYKEFCKKKILPLLIKIEMWILIYNIFLSIFYHSISL